MNSVMEELGTVLAYRSTELLKDSETRNSGDIEGGSTATTGTAENKDGSPGPNRKRPRRVYSVKKDKPNMGPIIDERGAGGNGMLALCLSSRRNSECWNVISGKHCISIELTCFLSVYS